jgi:protein-disulfide isomerase
MFDRLKFPSLIGWLVVPLALAGAAILWLTLDPGFRQTRWNPDAATNIPEDEFEQRIRAYLMKNPQVILEAVEQLQARRQAEGQSEAAAVLKARAEEIFRDPASPVGGNPGGDVTLVEFFDYNCPYCRQVAPVMAEAEAADPQLRVVYKEFPILGPGSAFAAKAALAVHRQGKYLEFHKALMAARGAVDEARTLAVAAAVGVDIERMKANMNNPEIETAIENNLALARALRIDGTPSFVIGERILRGAADLKTMQGLIREARERE